MKKEDLKGNIFLGVVEDNDDPRKLGRVKVRVNVVFDDIPKEDIPWAFPHKDLNGNTFLLPEIGKIVSVMFDQGNIYEPIYLYANHYNINLENKLNSLSGTDYTSMRAVLFDHATQIYRNESDGLKIDHEYTNINLDPNGNIQLNLRDSNSVISLGSVDAEENAVLGKTFMEWMDKLVDKLMGTPYYDSLGAPVTPSPDIVTTFSEYKSKRDDFISDHVKIAKNGNIISQKRDYIKQFGDGPNSKTESSAYTPDGSYTPSQFGSGTQVDRNPASIEKDDPSKFGSPETPRSFGGKATDKQKNAINISVNATLSRGEFHGKCARFTYNHAVNYTKVLSNKEPHQGGTLSAGGNAKDTSYHNELVKLGYKKVYEGVLSKSQIISELSKDYDIGDVVVYWGMDNTSGSYSRYGHTQIFTAGFPNGSNGYKWATDNKPNYKSTFVYRGKECDKWMFKVFKAPTA